MRLPRLAGVVAVLAVLIAACAPLAPGPTPLPVAGPAPASFPRGEYEQAAAQGHPVYQVDPARSLLVIKVRRGGTLARLGHDHVVASHTVQGFVAPDERRADLYVPLDELTVDEPELRAEAGLDTQPSASDIAGTRANMLDKVLMTQQFPYALIRVNGLEKTPTGGRLTLAVTLLGVTRTFEVPAQIEQASDAMRVAGSIEFKQSDFGIVPFSILGGAIQVQDGISLRFSIQARRVGSGAGPATP